MDTGNKVIVQFIIVLEFAMNSLGTGNKILKRIKFISDLPTLFLFGGGNQIHT
jgi:hypothetical protein